MEVEDDELAVARGLVGEGAHGLGGVPVAVRALRADGVDAREVGDESIVWCLGGMPCSPSFDCRG